MAARVLADNLGRGLSRMGESHTKGLGYLADATDGQALTQAFKEARVAIQHQASVEKAVVRSASALWTNVDEGRRSTAAFEPLIDQRAAALLNEVRAAFQLQAAQRGVPAAQPAATAEEREAARLMVAPTAVAGGGGPGGRGARGGPTLPDEFNAELNALLPKGMSVLAIRDFLSGEFTPVPLADLLAVLRAREASGAITLRPGSGRP
jgi:hypothetical protein